MITSTRSPGTLLGAMTWAEKLGQLQIIFRPRQEDAASLVRDGIGAMFWPRSAAAANALQREAVEQTRLGIPVLIGLDVIHGHRTIAPVPLAMAATFDPSHRRGSRSPRGDRGPLGRRHLDVLADGRHLARPALGTRGRGLRRGRPPDAVLGAAMVRGLPGRRPRSADAIAATAKHFVAYGQPEGGRDYNAVDVSPHRLRNVYLEPFRAAVDAGRRRRSWRRSTPSPGVPMHANRALLTEVLKREWGFAGVVVGRRRRRAQPAAARRRRGPRGRRARVLRRGPRHRDGRRADRRSRCTPESIDPARIDDAVARVLELKEALGLFDDPYVDEDSELLEPTEDAREIVRIAAARAAVLLKNDGTLPLGCADARYC